MDFACSSLLKAEFCGWEDLKRVPKDHLADVQDLSCRFLTAAEEDILSTKHFAATPVFLSLSPFPLFAEFVGVYYCCKK
ncbi:unnamed protein product [Larinioides sclopetarius]|uniref:Uncharacterized protein n=1 Tax=Larinioides sclopetarius TaxID=280406 RepID=A0AAV2A6M6_9ARAC